MTDATRTRRRPRLLARLRVRLSGGGREQELRALEARVNHLEAALQGLQDATHRQFVAQNDRLDELSQRARPEVIAQALSQDARDRGL